jgi:hypothetical protein
VNLAAPGLASGPNVAPAAVESETLVGPNAALPAKATEAKTEGPNVGPVMAPAKAEVAEFKAEGPNAGPAAAPVKPEKEVSGLMSFQPVKQSRMGRDYCEPCYTNCGDGTGGTPDDWITHVVFAGIDNTTGPEGCPCSYGDYTDLVANVAPGVTYPLTVSFYSEGVYTEYVTAWIDWNQNQVFDASEIYQLGGGIDATLTLDITVPPTALPGMTRMRVVERYASAETDPCASYSYAEAEDYSVFVAGDDVTGACCNIYTGACENNVEVMDCLPPLQFHFQEQCEELSPACGNPGCCCDEDAAVAFDEFAANCAGRFVAGAVGADCTIDVFTPPCGEWQPVGLLYCPTEADNSTFRSAVSAITGAPCDYFDARVATPSLELLQEYACVLTWVNYAYSDRVAMGNRLADYVDVGGHVILGQWTLHTTQVNWLEGRIMTAEYLPVTGSSYITSGTTYTGDGIGCEYVGVSTLQATYCDQVDVAPGAFWGSGTWATGKTVAAWRLDHHVVYASGHTGLLYSTGDWARFTVNLCQCTGEPMYGACCDPYTGDCADDIELMDCLPPLQFFWQEQCEELSPPCGVPGCCCDEDAAEVFESLKLNCPGRFAGGELGENCTIDTFVPPCGEWEPVGVLYCPANPDNPTFRAAVAAMTGAPCDYYDARVGTPSLDMLQEYQCVLTWVNYAYNDRDAMGNRLADYVDIGGHVILGQWCLPTAGNYLGGRIMSMSEMYCPVSGTSYTSGSYMGDGVGCEYEGVSSLSSSYVDIATLRVGPFWSSGTFSHGGVAGAWRLDKGVTYSAGNTGGSYSTGDWVQFTVNLCQCPGGDATGACCDPYTAVCEDEVDLQDCYPPLQFFWQEECAELSPPCGNPGCCCVDFASEIPFETLKIYCNGRHLSGVVGEDCVTEAFSPPCGEWLVCEHSVTMWDDWGDGWNGGYIDIYVDGSLEAAGVTLASGTGPAYAYFEAGTGSQITTVWTAGGWPYEASYCIYAVTGAELGCDGLGGVDPTGITVYGYCGEPGACCNPYTGECVDDVVWQECPAPLQHFGTEQCAELSPPCGDPGACCDDATATCEDDVFRLLCAPPARFASGAACDPDPFTPDCGLWVPAGLLYAPTEGDNPAFRAAVLAIIGDKCDYFDARTGVPPMDLLIQYSAVMTWVNYSYADSSGMGNRLAEFADAGGKVILGQWTKQSDQGNYLTGRIMEDCCPVLTTSTSYSSGSYAGDGVLWHSGVSSYDTSYLDVITVTADGAIIDGHFTTGSPSVVVLCAACGVWWCDLNGDMVVDSADLNMLYMAFGSQAGDPAWLPAADYDGDGRITLVDWQAWRQCYIDYLDWAEDPSQPIPVGGPGMVFYSAGNTGGYLGGGDWVKLTANMVQIPCEGAGACCDVTTGECVDDVDVMDCLSFPLQFHYQKQCDQLDPPCGDPGCCCEQPELGEIQDPVWSLAANCNGRFLSGVLGEDCVAEAFTPDCGLWEPVGILYAPSNPDNAAFRAEVTALTGSACDYYDARTGTPSLAMLMEYECVLTWVNYAYSNKDAMGDVLADFVDAGGHVLLGQWCLPTAGNYLGGRIMTDDYCPTTASVYATSTTYMGDGFGCEYYGVSSLSAQYCDQMSLRPGPTFGAGTWNTGTLVAGWRLDKYVKYAAGHTGGAYSSGNWAQFTVNLCSCPLGDVYGACCDPYTGICTDDVEVMSCLPPLQFTWETACAALVPPCGDPGACCDIYTSDCWDPVLRLNCQYARFESGGQCEELNPPCGTPGCCCEAPESGEITDPIWSLEANCSGRFLPGVFGADCVAEAFVPECGLWECEGMLYAPTEADSSTFRNQLAALLGQPVAYFDARVATPTLDQLEDYCTVLTWVNYAYADNVAMGNVLADFVDANGKVILGQWCLPTAGNYLSGRIMTSAYCPGTASSYASGNYMLDGQDCVHLLGPVGAYGGSYNDIVTPIAGAMWDGTVSHGGKAVVWRADRRVYYNSGNTGLQYTTGDWVRLTYNMIICTNEPLYGACCDPYTGACEDDVATAACAPPLQFFYQEQCGELSPPCGNPGCCCDRPESGEITDPHFSYEISCEGRFLPGVLGDNCVAEAFTPECGLYQACQHSITMWDDWGDGWNGGFIDVYVGGELVLSGLTLASGSGPGYAYFEAGHGEQITTVWTPGGWPYECSYCIYGYDGSEIGCDGMGGVDPTGITVYGSCQEPECGDGICQPSESCVTCPEDCGECECISQLPNQSNGIFSDIDCDFCGGDMIQILAEQFIIWEETTVVGVNCWGGYYPSDVPTASDAFTLIFRSNSGGMPGAEIAKFGPLAGTRAQTGVVLFGVHEYLHELPVNLALGAGTYWIELFNDTSGSSESWFWEAGNRDPTEGIAGQAYTFSAYPLESWSFDGGTDMAFELICE